MLQHNTRDTLGGRPVSGRNGRRAHIAHAAVVGLHTICCGMPLLAMAAVALSGAATGAAVFSRSAAQLHALLHTHELWIVALSAALVTFGGIMELNAARAQAGRGFPVLFAVSVACFALNVAIVLIHRGL